MIAWHRNLVLTGALLTWFVVTSPPVNAASPCLDVRVEYRGREPVQNIGGVQFYRWTYRVYGQGCINRALSHWTLVLCASAQVLSISDICVDASDPGRGMTTNYLPVVGNDPTTGIRGVKWNFAAGNPIDRNAEWDEFSFVASGNVTEVDWAVKAGQLRLFGSTFGPTCQPVPVRNIAWGAIKAAYGD
jgi:hypothetical protein